MNTNRDRIRCFKGRGYDHFAEPCPNSVTNEDSDHDDISQSVLQMLLQDEYVSTELHETMEHLNL